MSQSTSQPQPNVLLAMQQFIEVIAQLRSPDGGCPWDLSQTPQTLTPFIIEEAYETVAAINSGDQQAIAEELGDLLLQVVLQAQIATEFQHFTLTDVIRSITEKMIRRHPHVFGDQPTNDIEQVRQTWEQIKAQEVQAKANQAETDQSLPPLSKKLSEYARQLPPLLAGMKISRKAAGAGFEWDNIEGVWEKFQEEVAEFQEALQSGDKAHQESELGDILFTLINLARWCNLDPEAALRETNHRFVRRFTQVEMASDRPLTEYSLEELEALWQAAKAQLSKTS
ncbi:MAG: nucleoside triphosphate pyrophosphohydrolase [Microcoleaceae cyanobacterium]